MNAQALYAHVVRFSPSEQVTVLKAEFACTGSGVLVHYITQSLALDGSIIAMSRVAYVRDGKMVWSMIID